jgi:hypothetical protein
MPTPICDVLHDTLTPIAARRGDFMAWHDDDTVQVYDGQTTRLLRAGVVDPVRVRDALAARIIAPASPRHAALTGLRLLSLQQRAAS